jgi:hypothetical protein
VQPPPAQFVTGARALDLDHLGAEVGQQPAGRRRGDEAAELEDAETGKRSARVRHRTLHPYRE